MILNNISIIPFLAYKYFKRVFVIIGLFVISVGATKVSAITISFDGLLDSQSPINTYSESGFLIEPLNGNWFYSGYGNPKPAIIFIRPASEVTTSASIKVTNNGNGFYFNSIDLYSSVTAIPYIFTGFLDSYKVFSVNGTLPNTFGRYKNVQNLHSEQLIDTLEITLFNPGTGCCSNPVGLDNIEVKPESQPVPPPAATNPIPTLSEWAMILLVLMLAGAGYSFGRSRLE